jgi:hypothetical protein
MHYSPPILARKRRYKVKGEIETADVRDGTKAAKLKNPTDPAL